MTWIKTNYKNEIKILFSIEIDRVINSLALACAFIIIGIFLTFNKSYLSNEIISTFFQCSFLLMGVIGLSIEISNNSKFQRIKGLGDLTLGVVFIGLWFFTFLFWNFWWSNIIALLLLFFGIYEMIRGILAIGYSIKTLKIQNEGKSLMRGNIITDLILNLSRICGLILILVQILQALRII